MTWKDPTIPWAACSPERQADLRAVWAAGNLRWKLDPSQRAVYDEIQAFRRRETRAARRWWCLDIGRRWGKDFVMTVIAVETAIRTPRRWIPYGAMTQKSARDIFSQIISRVLADCPPELLPKPNEERKEQAFANGSVIKLAGVNEDPDTLRGTSLGACFMTECGFYRRIEYVFESVVRPMQMTEPDSFVITGSTPAETPEHGWSKKYVPVAQAEGRSSHRTIYDNPRIDRETADAFVKEAGGPQATRARREYFAEHVPDAEKAVVPEMTEHGGRVVKPVTLPRHFIPFVAADLGFHDMSAAIAGTFDFRRAKLLVLDETIGQGERATSFDERVAEMERRVFGSRRDVRRFADAPPLVLAELNREGADQTAWWNRQDVSDEIRGMYTDGRYWSKTRNDDLQAQVNSVREVINADGLEIDPRCTTTIAHTKHGVWNESRTAFDRIGDNGHFDALAALIYLDRNVDRRTNPYPALESFDPDTQVLGRGFVLPTGGFEELVKREWRPG